VHDAGCESLAVIRAVSMKHGQQRPLYCLRANALNGSVAKFVFDPNQEHPAD
jgi:hypothetical protein